MRKWLPAALIAGALVFSLVAWPRLPEQMVTHWNVRGANFIAIHELLDLVVAHAQDGADQAAERIVALGLPIDARVSTVAAKTATAVPAGFTQWDALIRTVISDMDTVIADVQAAIDGLDEFDLTSQDIAIGIKESLEKDRWFLFAHVAE